MPTPARFSTTNRTILEDIANALIEYESLDGERLRSLIARVQQTNGIDVPVNN
jgi:ATP-dependent Zn protease